MATNKTPLPAGKVPFLNQPVYVSYRVPGYGFTGFILRARPGANSASVGAALNIDSLVALAVAQNLVLRPLLEENKLQGDERTLFPLEILKLRDSWIKAYRASSTKRHVFACTAGLHGGVEVRAVPLDYGKFWDAEVAATAKKAAAPKPTKSGATARK